MRFVRALVLAPFALALIAATCVTNVEQQGDRGPWVGEVVNTGTQTVHAAGASARVTDAEGREYYPGYVGVLACPSKLLPGETGAFQLFVPTENMNPEWILEDPNMPLHADFARVLEFPIGTGQARGDGLYVEELSRDIGEKNIHVRLTNNGTGAYAQYTVCAVVRDSNKAIHAVGRADGPPLPEQLAPGESIELTIWFESLPEGTFTIRYHTLGLLSAPYTHCCPLGASTWHSVDLKWFSVLLPPDWQYVPAQGIDSFVGQFAGPEGSLWFDFGPYSNNLSFENDPAYRMHLETIGGRTAKIAEVIGASGTTGVNIPIAATEQFPSSSLTIAGGDLSPEAREIALQVFRSIRICECAEP